MLLADAVRKYDAASRHYDRFMDIVFGKVLNVERHRERVVALLGNVDGKTVIDVGCGTGRNFPLLVSAVGEHGRVIGLDCSDGMLARARQRVRRHGWHNVELVHGDAVELDGIREPVDAVLSVWCYGTVYDLAGALRRAADVLHPGGRLAIMTFMRASPERGPLHRLYPFYRLVVRCAGVDPAGDFDNTALEKRWEHGRNVLRGLLWDIHEEKYLQGAGLIIAGRKPLQAAVTAPPARLFSDEPAGDEPGPVIAPPYRERARRPGSA